MLTNQEIFDKVKNHLLSQSKKALFDSLDDGGFEICAYRAPDGCKCAVGVLIADEFYDEKFENKNVSCYQVQDALRSSGVDMDNPSTKSLVSRLQSIHDDFLPHSWEAELQRALERNV